MMPIIKMDITEFPAKPPSNLANEYINVESKAENKVKLSVDMIMRTLETSLNLYFW